MYGQSQARCSCIAVVLQSLVIGVVLHHGGRCQHLDIPLHTGQQLCIDTTLHAPLLMTICTGCQGKCNLGFAGLRHALQHVWQQARPQQTHVRTHQ